MLLNELVDVDRPRTIKKQWSDEEFAHGREEIGSGQTTRAFKSRTPGAVDRLMYVRGLDDPYLQFIRTIQKHDDNPYFPRILHAKLQETGMEEDGEPIYRVLMQMEELIPLKNEKIIRAMDDKLRQLGLLDEEHLSRAWLKVLFKDKYNQLMNSDVDPKFAEALRILKPFVDKFGNDLHHKNLMVRLTGTGPQLVLIDPIVPHYFHPPFDE